MDWFLLVARKKGVHIEGQGLEVETMSIACRFGGMLLAQIKHSRKSIAIFLEFE